MKKSDEEWRAQLTPDQFRIARQGGTERAFTGAYWDTKDKGVYRCICCGSELFSSETKYNSGSGWPSFWASYDGSIRYEDDYRLLVHRTEIRCATCDAHLGHVFDDGPEPSGKRYCVNSASLNLVRDDS